jgi:hypothetical protein
MSDVYTRFCTLPCTDKINQSEDTSVVTTSTSSPISDNERFESDIELGSK